MQFLRSQRVGQRIRRHKKRRPRRTACFISKQRLSLLQDLLCLDGLVDRAVSGLDRDVVRSVADEGAVLDDCRALCADSCAFGIDCGVVLERGTDDRGLGLGIGVDACAPDAGVAREVSAVDGELDSVGVGDLDQTAVGERVAVVDAPSSGAAVAVMKISSSS